MSRVINAGFVWCDMCGYNAKVKPEHAFTLAAGDIVCRDCGKEGMFSYLEWGTELPDHVTEDEPMPTYKP